jgi:glycerate kinase
VRNLVATDSIGAMSSREAGEVIASGWRPGAEVAVLPIGAAGAGFVTAYADLAGITTSTRVIDGRTVTTGMGSSTAVVRVQGSDQADQRVGIPYQQSSRPIGEAIAAVVRSEPPQRILVDLTGLWIHDAGAGMLAALGAIGDRPLDQGIEGLTGLSQLDLAPAHALLGKTELVGVVPAAELDQQLFGLRGITARVGRELSEEPELMLQTDATLEAFARLASPTNAATPGAGSCSGLGFAVLALSGQLTTGPALALSSSRGQAALREVDLVATGCSVFDFASRGGGVVAAMAEAASAVLSPCIVIAGEVVIGSREMRTMGIEAAYAVRESVLDDPRGDVSEPELSATARRVARSWTW